MSAPCTVALKSRHHSSSVTILTLILTLTFHLPLTRRSPSSGSKYRLTTQTTNSNYKLPTDRKRSLNFSSRVQYSVSQAVRAFVTTGNLSSLRTCVHTYDSVYRIRDFGSVGTKSIVLW